MGRSRKHKRHLKHKKHYSSSDSDSSSSSSTSESGSDGYSKKKLKYNQHSRKGKTDNKKKHSRCFVKEKSILHILNAVATPRANGQIERYNRTIVNALTATNHGRPDSEWDTHISKVQWGLNNTINQATGKSASEVLFGVAPTGSSEAMMNSVVADSVEIMNREEIRQHVELKIAQDQQKQKARFDKSRKKAKIYQVGDLVRVEREINSHTGQSKKLQPKCSGPYRVSKVLGNDRYEIIDTPITKREGKPVYKNVFAVDKIHPWLVFSNDLMETDSESE
ncbi:unnamed protein product [Parnassius mnemosyne]|uniref:Integrase catalytic domain-containing protein n=1 Tax=Parnassius mnemosyne TaxID=213953 RepID=A0AAV1M018_9NEOP